MLSINWRLKNQLNNSKRASNQLIVPINCIQFFGIFANVITTSQGHAEDDASWQFLER